MISQTQIEFMHAFSELNKLTRREPSQGMRLTRFKKLAYDLQKKDPVCGNTLFGLISCLERDVEAMHAFHKQALEFGESCFSLVYYAVSLEKSCLWSEATRFGLLALDYDPNNAKLLEAVIRLVPLAGRFSLYKRLLPHWQEAHDGVPHPGHSDDQLVNQLLAVHGLLEKDLRQLICAVGDALSETNLIIKQFGYEIVNRSKEAPFLHYRFAIDDDLVATHYEDLIDAKLAQLHYHPRLFDAFSFSVENAAVHRLYEYMDQELAEDSQDLRIPDPERMRLIEDLVQGVRF
jgi:hypothetical protein